MTTVGELLDEGAARIGVSTHIDHWQEEAERYDAESFLAEVVHDVGDLDADVSAAAAKRYREMVRRRAAGEPSARILGFVDFLELRIPVHDGAFFPRISSETMATEAVRRLRGRDAPVHVDLATGVGTVALAVGAAVPRARIYGVDVMAKAVKGARSNAKALGVMRATFLQGDLFEPLPAALRGAVDVVTIHPPYVARDEVRDQPKEITKYEPVVTLTDGSPDGLGIVHRVTGEALGWLAPSGWLLMEVGADMGRRVASILKRAGYRDVTAKLDEYGVTRTVSGRRPR
ncbi:MAG: peptide chain release factor N(5)-glutamine methyltransferase [Actinobacteria bacterium]|nr:peptide chain release factor N(5)-glutamine methyltransferase [Actinomycetota bacterium]